MMLLIQNIHVFNPEYQGVKDVLITGNTIHKIADSLPVTAAYDMKIIDGTGNFLIPGLIDSHVHILGGGGEGGPKTRTPEITKQIVADQHLTALMVTHNMKDAIATGNRLIMMYEGRIIFEASGEDKKKLTVDELMRKFSEVAGEEFSNDQALLTR